MAGFSSVIRAKASLAPLGSPFWKRLMAASNARRCSVGEVTVRCSPSYWPVMGSTLVGCPHGFSGGGGDPAPSRGGSAGSGISVEVGSAYADRGGAPCHPSRWLAVSLIGSTCGGEPL